MGVPNQAEGLYVMPARVSNVLVVALTDLAAHSLTLAAGGYWTLVADGGDIWFLTGLVGGSDPDPTAVAGAARCDKLESGARLDQWFADDELVIKAICPALDAGATAAYLRAVKSSPPRL